MDAPLPLMFLASLLAVTVLAFAIHRALRHRRKEALRKLASQRGMQYSQSDLFALADRIGPTFPVPGAADLRVIDLIYATRTGRHLYVFTTEYTRGVSQRQWREEMVVGFCEPTTADGTNVTPLTPAREGLTILEGYGELLKRWDDHSVESTASPAESS